MTIALASQPGPLPSRVPGSMPHAGTLPARALAASSQQADPVRASVAPPEALDAVIEEANRAYAHAPTSLRFEKDETSGRIVVAVVDAQTNEVVRQLPSEEMLALARRLDRAQGLLMRERA